MDLKHEEIQTNERIPIKLFNFQANDIARIIPNHWHKSAEILYCRKGSLNVWINNKNYLLREGDFLFINSNIIHSTQSPTENDIMVLQFPLPFLQEATQQDYLEKYDILCNTLLQSSNEQETAFSRVREILEEMLLSETQQEDAFSLKIYSLVFELLYVLIRHFKVEKKGDSKLKTQKYLDRLGDITEYVKANYDEKITLDSVATEFNFSIPYFARFFKRYMGITFTEYVTSIRLDKAFDLLMNSDLSILDISLAVGFPNSKSYTASFKKTYGHTPYHYKKLYMNIKDNI
ncbi:MAG: AraC family transcriptional regulator [Angelakisella sp.]|nr:AraC family transcriptional regulator [Angelakisella sp.]